MSKQISIIEAINILEKSLNQGPTDNSIIKITLERYEISSICSFLHELRILESRLKQEPNNLDNP